MVVGAGCRELYILGHVFSAGCIGQTWEGEREMESDHTKIRISRDSSKDFRLTELFLSDFSTDYIFF